MSPRIETSDVVTFRLVVPMTALEQLADEQGALPLVVDAGAADGTVRVTSGDSQLRFKPSLTGAVLTEVVVHNDERGLFFQRVLGPLMVRFQGDLHIQLCWNLPERNTHGTHAEVRIVQGVTTYPGLSLMRNVVAPPGPKTSAPPLPKELPAPEDKVERAPTPEELEIERLLEEGRKYFDEYQRLKAKGQAQTA